MSPNADYVRVINERWAACRGRCIYCSDDDAVFHSVCDCGYHEKVCNVEGCMGK